MSTRVLREQWGPASWVTLTRATLAVAVAALVADSFTHDTPVALLVALAAASLVLDAVDGALARRTGTVTALGARFDGEVDAFLILALSVYAAPTYGAWVLAMGAARYVFGAGELLLPWMRRPLPPRRWRRVVAATVGIVLTVAAAGVLPHGATQGLLAVALVLLAASMGECAWWLWRRRHERIGFADDDAPPGTLRTGLAGGLTVLAALVVWLALVAPDEPSRFHLAALARLPLEGFVLIALAALAPGRARRALTWVAGPLLGLIVLLKILDIGFFAAFNRPFDPYQDVSYAGIGSETLHASVGASAATMATVGLALFILALFAVMALAVRRLTRIAAGQRAWALRVVVALGAVWLLCWGLGARFVPGTPIASTSAADLVVQQVGALRADLSDRATFAREIGHDRFGATPGDRLLTGLRGKDVLLAFVESYGRVAVQGSSFSPRIDALLDRGTSRLRAAGFSARSAFLTSPTFGGISWLAHSTMQSGVWVNSRRRYAQLTASRRFTLSQAFGRAGWRTVDDVPSNDRAWAPGRTFYHYDKVYDRRNVGYHGPTFAYASMPDQYVLSALQRLELAKRHRRPLFAELDLVSSHTPWTRIPTQIPWGRVGDGSIFNRIPVRHTSSDSLSVNAAWAWLARNGAAPARAAYAQSIEYTLNTLVSFVRRYRDPNLVLVVLGDHQPWSIVSGQQPGHDVPISVIAHDPKVMRQIAGWGFSDGLRPSPRAPVWPMSAFRDRFLTAFGSQPAR